MSKRKRSLSRFETAADARAAVDRARAVCRASRVRFNAAAARFEDPVSTRVLPGLRPKLRAALFPHYIAPRAKRSSSTARIGSLVDDELTRYAETGRLESTQRTRKLGKQKRPHAFSRCVAARLQKEHISLVGAQVGVRMNGCATALDLVGWDATDGALVQIEVKTGMDTGSRTKRMGTLPPPFSKLPNAPLSHAFLQAAWAQSAARASGIPVKRSVVMVVNSTKACRAAGGRWHPLPPAVRGKEALRALRRSVQTEVRTGAQPPPSPIQTGRLPWEQ